MTAADGSIGAGWLVTQREPVAGGKVRLHFYLPASGERRAVTIRQADDAPETVARMGEALAAGRRSYPPGPGGRRHQEGRPI